MSKVSAGMALGLVLGLGAVSAGSALDMSFGGGGFFGSGFGGGIEGTLGGSMRLGSISGDMTLDPPYLGGGVYGFFDAEYAQVSVGYFIAGGAWKFDGKYSVSVLGMVINEGSYSEEMDASFQVVNIGLLGKYPIALSGKFKLFPIAGVEYQLCLSGEYKFKEADGKEVVTKWDGKPADPSDPDSDKNPNAGDFNALWIKFGAGLDVGLTDKLFLRPELLYGIRFASKIENDAVDDANALFEERAGGTGAKADIKTRLGHGFMIKVGIGRKL